MPVRSLTHKSTRTNFAAVILVHQVKHWDFSRAVTAQHVLQIPFTGKYLHTDAAWGEGLWCPQPSLCKPFWYLIIFVLLTLGRGVGSILCGLHGDLYSHSRFAKECTEDQEHQSCVEQSRALRSRFSCWQIFVCSGKWDQWYRSTSSNWQCIHCFGHISWPRGRSRRGMFIKNWTTKSLQKRSYPLGNGAEIEIGVIFRMPQALPQAFPQQQQFGMPQRQQSFAAFPGQGNPFPQGGGFPAQQPGQPFFPPQAGGQAPAGNPLTQSSPNNTPSAGRKRTETIGPFQFWEKVGHQSRHGVVNYPPEDLHRVYPHLARGSFGIVFKGAPERKNPY